MSEAKQNFWRVLAFALAGSAWVGLGLWIYLLSTICSAPHIPDPTTGNVIAYNCHGLIVFISQAQHILLLGLIPALVVIGACGKLARKRGQSIPGQHG